MFKKAIFFSLDRSMFIHPEVLPKAQYNEMVNAEISTMDFVLTRDGECDVIYHIYI